MLSRLKFQLSFRYMWRAMWAAKTGLWCRAQVSQHVRTSGWSNSITFSSNSPTPSCWIPFGDFFSFLSFNVFIFIQLTETAYPASLSPFKAIWREFWCSSRTSYYVCTQIQDLSIKEIRHLCSKKAFSTAKVSSDRPRKHIHTQTHTSQTSEIFVSLSPAKNKHSFWLTGWSTGWRCHVKVWIIQSGKADASQLYAFCLQNSLNWTWHRFHEGCWKLSSQVSCPYRHVRTLQICCTSMMLILHGKGALL